MLQIGVAMANPLQLAVTANPHVATRNCCCQYAAEKPRQELAHQQNEPPSKRSLKTVTTLGGAALLTGDTTYENKRILVQILDVSENLFLKMSPVAPFPRSRCHEHGAVSTEF